MKINIQKTLDEILPWLIIGLGVSLFIGLLMVLSYVFIWGLVIGALLWVGFRVKLAWSKQNSQSSTIEHKSREEK